MFKLKCFLIYLLYKIGILKRGSYLVKKGSENNLVHTDNLFGNQVIYFPYENASEITKLIADVFNKFKPYKKCKTYIEKADAINHGDCYNFIYKILVEMRARKLLTDNVKVVIIQHIHCFLIIDNTIYDSENMEGATIHCRTTLDIYIAKWLWYLNHNDPDKVVQYEVIEKTKKLDNGDTIKYEELKETGQVSFDVPELDCFEQEEVWMSGAKFLEVYERGLEDFRDCAFWPYTPEKIVEKDLQKYFKI